MKPLAVQNLPGNIHRRTSSKLYGISRKHHKSLIELLEGLQKKCFIRTALKRGASNCSKLDKLEQHEEAYGFIPSAPCDPGLGNWLSSPFSAKAVLHVPLLQLPLFLCLSMEWYEICSLQRSLSEYARMMAGWTHISPAATEETVTMDIDNSTPSSSSLDVTVHWCK